MLKGLELARAQSSDPDLVEEMQRMLKDAEEELKADTAIPGDHSERVRFNKMFDWLK